MMKSFRKICLAVACAVATGFALSDASAQTVHVNDDLSATSAPNNLGIWTANRGSHPTNWAVWEQDPNGTANKSFWVDGGSLQRIYGSPNSQWDELRVRPSHAEPMVFSFSFYDFMTPTGAGRVGEPLVYGELQLAGGGTPLFAAGLAAQSWFNTSLGSVPATFDATRYQARMYPTASGSTVNNWFQLATERREGWVTFTFVVRPDTFDIYVNGQLDANATNLLWRTATSTPPEFGLIRMGGGFSTVGAPALFDNIYLATDANYARDLIINQHPARQWKPYGESVTFTVDATGSGDLSYQWTKDGVALTNDGRITGAQTPTLSISNLTPDDRGNYRVIVSNLGGQLPSSSANLYVTEEFEVIVNAMDVPTDAVVGTWNTAATGGWFGYRWRGLVSTATQPEPTVTFRPVLPVSGYYDIYTWYVPSAVGGNRPTEAPYIIHHADGEDRVWMNQQQPNGNKWEKVAERVRFEAGSDGKVVISAHIQEGRSGGDALMADAVRWVLVPDVALPPAVAIRRGAAGEMDLLVSGQASASYSVESSADLVTWTAIGTVQLDSEGNGIFTDSNAGQVARRFYRVGAQ
jgi:hypothetical protein